MNGFLRFEQGIQEYVDSGSNYSTENSCPSVVDIAHPMAEKKPSSTGDNEFGTESLRFLLHSGS